MGASLNRSLLCGFQPPRPEDDVAATASSRIWQFPPVLSALFCAPCRTVPSLVRAPGYSSLSCLLMCDMSCFFAYLCLAANVLLAVRPGSWQCASVWVRMGQCAS